MPQIVAALVPAQAASKPATPPSASAVSGDTDHNQPFGGVLQGHLDGSAETSAVDEAIDPSVRESAVAPVLAADGKELPPDIAALIAASQPPANPPTQASARLPDSADDMAGSALARAALTALQGGNNDAPRSTRTTADAKAITTTQDFTMDPEASSASSPGLDARSAQASGIPSSQTGIAALPEGLSAKDIVLVLADSRSLVSATPGLSTLIPAGNTPSAPPASAVPSTPLPFAQPGWEQGLGNRVMWMVNQQVQTAELRMHPAHLGPLEVRISIRDDQATVSFVSAHGQVREALQAAIPHLRDMLGDSGLNLSNVNIAQHSFADARQRPDDPPSHAHGGPEQTVAGKSHDEMPIQIGRLGLVDYYV